jgi:hypothetical protein
MLPSSNGSGQLPPQAANGGSNPSGSAIPPLCPCHGPLSCYGGSITARCRLNLKPVKQFRGSIVRDIRQQNGYDE